jgi:hypothetical protein
MVSVIYYPKWPIWLIRHVWCSSIILSFCSAVRVNYYLKTTFWMIKHRSSLFCIVIWLNCVYNDVCIVIIVTNITFRWIQDRPPVFMGKWWRVCFVCYRKTCYKLTNFSCLSIYDIEVKSRLMSGDLAYHPRLIGSQLDTF